MKSAAIVLVKTPEAEEVKINSVLQSKYDDQPLFVDKVNRANVILKKFGIPKFYTRLLCSK